jgi:diguanylate cyclase
MPMLDLKSFSSFHDAAQAALSYLRERMGFDLWMVTRTEGDDWIVLQSEDHGYGVKGGDLFRWADSFCSRMVMGYGPRFAPSSQDVPAYVTAPIGVQVSIGAYVGVPLTWRDGNLFGTLCAIHPTPVASELEKDLPLVELLARLLSSILEDELAAAEQKRRLERAEVESLIDELTGIYNRRGWNRLMAAEEARHHRYGHPASLISIDLDGLKTINDSQGHQAGDDTLRSAAKAIRSVLRQQDVAARLGGDEFAILAVECDGPNSAALVGRLASALAASSIEASVAYQSCRPNESFSVTWQKADQKMYDHKRVKSSRLDCALSS